MNGTWLSVTHTSEYRYSTRVDLAHHVAHLVPRNMDHQVVDRCVLNIDPAPSDLSNGDDAFGNVRSLFSLYGPHQGLRVKATSRVRVAPACPSLDPGQGDRWEAVCDSLRYRAGRPYTAATEFTFASPFVPRARELGQYALASLAPGRPLAAAAIDLMHRVYADFDYRPASTEISTPLLKTFRARAGVCQDFAHVMIGCLRSAGLSARYVSGYLLTEAGDEGDRPVGADASHAWVSVYCPPLGWLDLDPTNDAIVQDRHVIVAYGRDYGDVAPLRGVMRGGGDHVLGVAVHVARETAG
jgi:transglutaminase-like putative cysteine protease